MSDRFNLWHAHSLTPTRLTFDVTPADAFSLGSGTASFVSDCLEQLGVTARPDEWTISSGRQSYYSDYLHSSDWRARWDIVWIFDVKLASPFEFKELVTDGPIATSVMDSSAANDSEPKLDSGIALVLALFPSLTAAEVDAIDCVKEWSTSTGIETEVRMVPIIDANGRALIRGVTESVKFPDVVDSLEELQTKLRRIGGSTNWATA